MFSSYYLEQNIWVNLYTVDSSWLYSLYWCMNVTSITTNRCQEFAQMTSPVWHMVGNFDVFCFHCIYQHLFSFCAIFCVLCCWTL